MSNEIKKKIDEKKALPKLTKKELIKSNILRQTSIYEFMNKTKKPKKKIFI